MSMYRSADIVIEYLNKIFYEEFARLKSVVAMDELNVLNKVKTVYLKLYDIIKELFYELAVEAYETAILGDYSLVSDITPECLYENVLERYDPVTLYVLDNEIERRYYRTSEAIIASGYDSDVFDKALRQLSAIATQYAITTVDMATIQAYRDSGVTKVVWISKEDAKRCPECKKRHGKVYDIDNIPPKPHLYCRCELRPWNGAKQ